MNDVHRKSVSSLLVAIGLVLMLAPRTHAEETDAERLARLKAELQAVRDHLKRSHERIRTLAPSPVHLVVSFHHRAARFLPTALELRLDGSALPMRSTATGGEGVIYDGSIAKGSHVLVAIITYRPSGALPYLKEVRLIAQASHAFDAETSATIGVVDDAPSSGDDAKRGPRIDLKEE